MRPVSLNSRWRTLARQNTPNCGRIYIIDRSVYYQFAVFYRQLFYRWIIMTVRILRVRGTLTGVLNVILKSGLCKVRTGWRRMADGGWRIEKCGWQNADDKMRMTKCGWQNADDKMRMTKCGWQNADDKMRMTKCGWQNADDKMRMIKWGWKSLGDKFLRKGN